MNFVDELLQPSAVARNRVVVKPASYDRCQPACRLAQGTMHAFAQLLLDRSERCSHSLGNADSSDREPPMSSRFTAHVRKAEKVKRLGTPFAACCSPFGRKATEFDQTRFLFVQLQAKLGKAGSECFQARNCLASLRETNHKVVRITDHDDIASTVVLSPPLHPQVEHVVQEHVRQQW